MQRKPWSVVESHGRNTFSDQNVCEEGGVSIVRKQNQSRKRHRSAEEKLKETKDIRQLKKLASKMSRFMWRFTSYQLVIDADIFAAERKFLSFASLKHISNSEIYLFQAYLSVSSVLEYQTGKLYAAKQTVSRTIR